MAHSYTHLLEDIREIRSELKDIRREINRNKGFVGGIAWAFGALSLAIQLVMHWLKGAVQ